ncbi:MAG: TolC family protein [Bacteroidaceae bacterium]|nr:TolC family protein [Bacteroidaceae bacterium]
MKYVPSFRVVFLFLCAVSCGTLAAQNSMSLAALRDSALQNNVALRRARLDIESYSLQRKEAFTKYFPTVSATGMWFNANRSMAKMDMDPSEFITPELGASLAQSLPAEALAALSSPMSMAMMKDGTIASIMAVQPVFAGGQIVLGNKLARVGEEASELQMQLSENDVETQVEQYYWQLISLQEKQRTLDAVDSLLATLSNDVTVAVEAGVALRNDLLQVQLRKNDIQSQRLKLDNGMSILHLLLTQFCGLKSDWTLATPSLDASDASLAAGSASLAETGLQPVSSSFLAALPEYQLLQKNVEAANLQRRMEVGKNLPSLAVGAGYNYHNLLENDRHFGMVFATLSVPISDWWGGSHAIKRRKIAEQQAKEQLADNAELLTIRMQKAWNDVVEAQSQLALAEQGILQATENLRVQHDTYQAGTSTMSDLLEAQLLYQQTLDKRVDAFIALETATLEYRHATGQ